MKKIILRVLLAAALYIALGAILPFVVQPKVTEKTKAAVHSTRFCGQAPSGERVALLETNGEALEERIRLISQAEERIVLSTFDFRADSSGKQMLAALRAAAQRGVQVQVLVDGNAATLYVKGNPYFRALSAMEEAEIRIYNPMNFLTPWKLMGRLHDKYLIADDEAYILGGRNTDDFFLGAHDGQQNLDLDVLVWAEQPGAGESVGQLFTYFESVWSSSLCKPFCDDSRYLERASVRKAAAKLDGLYATMAQEHPDWLRPCDYTEKTFPANQIQLVTNPTHCYAKEPVVFYTITELMEKGQENIRFHTPYIICNRWMTQRLADICRSVPQVTMMTNSPANNGNPFGAMDYLSHKGRILETGVTIRELDGGTSYHGKCFAIDKRLSGIGSFNWDMRSAYLDTEMMLIIDSEGLNSALRAYMAEFDEQSLNVLDKHTALSPPGHIPQKMPVLKGLVLGVLWIFGDWARFLL